MVSMRIELSEGWLKFIRSQATVLVPIVTCLTLTFGPLALFNLGKAGVDYRDPRVIACFAMIVLVPLVYVRLATLFIKQLRSASEESVESVSARSAMLGASTWVWAVLVIAALALYILLRR